jgi:hypothetical protein
MLLGSFVAVASLSLQTRNDAEVVAVLYPPWWSERQMMLAVASADAAFVRLTSATGLVVVRYDQHQGLSKLHRSGAVLLMNPQAIAACMRG